MAYEIEQVEGDEATGPVPLSIYEITELIEKSLQQDPRLRKTLVVGEITQYSRHSSGHIYFTLADKEHPPGADPKKKAIIKCSFFRYHNKNLDFEPKPGMEVLVSGYLSLYYQGGQYSINVRKMAEVGAGNLLLKIQQLKQKLIENGVIDPSRRKELPLLPRKVGIVTGIGSAGLRDILKQVKDRYENVNLLIAPARVQGDLAADSLVAALNEISKPEYGCDLVIIGRGGGSVEDLMAFNDEKLAMAIAHCPLPVISAVGHQTDHPISDDVADVAAATPTDAAKIALPLVEEYLESLQSVGRNLERQVRNRFDFLNERLQRLTDKSFYHDPMVLLEGRYQRLDDLEQQVLANFKDLLQQKRDGLAGLADFDLLISQVLKQHRFEFEKNSERLAAYSPLATLKRGFSVTYMGDKIVRNADEVAPGDELEIQLAEGRLKATASKKISG